MIYISHRGNIEGSEPDYENKPSYIQEAIEKGYDVEIDLWVIKNELMLGHDEPQYKVDRKLLLNPWLWIHAKNPEALELIVEYSLRGFWHTDEDFVLTTKGHIWVYPGKTLLNNSIAVLPEIVSYTWQELGRCYAICSDDIEYYRNNIRKFDW